MFQSLGKWARNLLERRTGNRRLTPEERGFYLEREVKELPRLEVASLYLPGFNAWCTKSGYFRLWRDELDSKGIDFAQNLEDFNQKNVVNVRIWKADEPVSLTDIQHEIDTFTCIYEKGKIYSGTLYGTEVDREWRHAGIAYRHYPAALKAFLNEPDATYLTNLHGHRLWQRVIRRLFDNGISLFEILKDGNDHPNLDIQSICDDPRRTENLVIAHYQSIVIRHLKKDNPISKHDRKLHPYYYKAATVFWSGFRLYTRGVKLIDRAEEVEHHARLGRRVYKYVTDIIPLNLLAGVYFAPAIIAEGLLIIGEGILLAVGLSRSDLARFIKGKIRREHSPKDEIAAKLDIISPFNKILRPRNPEIFSQRKTTYISMPTFDSEFPLLLNQARDADEERLAKFLGPDSGRTVGSAELFHFKKPGNVSHSNLWARRLRRPDGVETIEMVAERRLLIFGNPAMAGFHAYPDTVISCRPSTELREIIEKGDIVDINLKNPRKPNIRFLSKAAAAEMLGKMGLKDADCYLHTNEDSSLPEILHLQKRYLDESLASFERNARSAALRQMATKLARRALPRRKARKDSKSPKQLVEPK